MPFNSIHSINHYQQVLSLVRIISQSFYSRVKKDSSSFISFLQRPVGSHTSGCIQWKGRNHHRRTRWKQGVNHFRSLSDIITTTCMNYRLTEKRPQLNSSDWEAPPAEGQNVSLHPIVTRSWTRFGHHSATKKKWGHKFPQSSTVQVWNGVMTWFGSPQWVIRTDGFGCGSCGVILQHTNTVGRCTERKVGVSNLAKVISDRNMGGALPLCVVFPRRLAVSRLEGVWWILIPWQDRIETRDHNVTLHCAWCRRGLLQEICRQFHLTKPSPSRRSL